MYIQLASIALTNKSVYKILKEGFNCYAILSPNSFHKPQIPLIPIHLAQYTLCSGKTCKTRSSFRGRYVINVTLSLPRADSGYWFSRIQVQ